MAFGDHLAQLIPESDSKSNKGQVVKVYLERLMDKAGNGIFDNKTVTIKIIVGSARSGVYFEKDNRIITYALADYSEEELAKMFFFFEEFTVRLGLLYIGEETGDIYSESFLRADPLTQGFVELGKAGVVRFATEAAAKNRSDYQNFLFLGFWLFFNNLACIFFNKPFFRIPCCKANIVHAGHRGSSLAWL